MRSRWILTAAVLVAVLVGCSATGGWSVTLELKGGVPWLSSSSPAASSALEASEARSGRTTASARTSELGRSRSIPTPTAR
ncbi:hypothetical protein ES703_61545 [subsurface metagenome]